MALPWSHWIWISRDEARHQYFEQASSLPVDTHWSVWTFPNHFHRTSWGILSWSFYLWLSFWMTRARREKKNKTKHRNSQMSPDKWIKVCQVETDHSKISRGPSQTEHPGGSLLCNPTVCIWKKSSVHFSFFPGVALATSGIIYWIIRFLISLLMGSWKLRASIPVRLSRKLTLDFRNMVDFCPLQGKQPFIHFFHSTSLADSLVHKILPLLFFQLYWDIILTQYNSPI